ncbi:hypothetical protein NP590_13085 [Methylomonas sp. SURF-2]|uniref:Paeninodin family lasso peptide n=1 Tax=Methylomonas subterranea TaxID=2952225 RepID=A0ABT1THV3_9GAMM|nr:hypothetical protein [Methylomonas sp. SURF-2]MCQ8105044.1 hypothetical protein [Methylomonas sp. SURF-2]
MQNSDNMAHNEKISQAPADNVPKLTWIDPEIEILAINSATEIPDVSGSGPLPVG